MTSKKIIYTKVDEAPALATHSLLPIIKSFTKTADISIELKDISLSGRILANFSDYLEKPQRVNNALLELGNLAQTPDANIIKLPNISASIPQLKAAISELQQQGYAIPNYPETTETAAEKQIKDTYTKVLGSAVNPVLREGNSDRRAPISVKNYAKKHPHHMGLWSSKSQTHVATMNKHDFHSNEKSLTLTDATTLLIQLIRKDGSKKTLKNHINVSIGDIIDATFMSKKHLCNFLDYEMNDAKNKNLLFSLHMKATMMKVSDPIIFGYAVKVYLKEVFEKYESEFNKLNINSNNGIQDILVKIKSLPKDKQHEIMTEINQCYQHGPKLAMVNSDKGITNLHVPSDIIIDASMPAMIRESGKMWGPNGELYDAKAVIPDSSYAGVYQATIEDCIQNGAFDPSTMGSVSNVGLMAQKAEEYGSHDKTFEIDAEGIIQVLNSSGKILLEHHVEKGDIWRMCLTKDIAIKDWVKLAVNRAKISNTPAVFWLNRERAHDKELIKKVNTYLTSHDTSNIEIHILSPIDATKFSLDRMRKGLDSISVTGNVLRDYNTDLFPILELGTSAKMLSIVPLINGGGLFETGAGGSAPKHVQQFEKENHLRWDSLGEFLALSASLEYSASNSKNVKARILAESLEKATEVLLDENKSPSRKVGELDNRGSHFYLALYWSQELAKQKEDLALREQFAPLAKKLSHNETTILNELNNAQGDTVNIGGYYKPNDDKTSQFMRPSNTFNTILESFNRF